MEEEDEQEDQEEEEEEALASPSDLGGVPWKEAVELHAKLRGKHSGDSDALVDAFSRDEELDEEEEEEEEDEDEDEESSDGKVNVDHPLWLVSIIMAQPHLMCSVR